MDGALSMIRVRRLSERVFAAAKSRLLRPVRALQAPLDPARPGPKGLWMAKRSPYTYVVVPKSGCTSAGQYLYFADHGRYYYRDVHQLQLGLYKASVDEVALQRRLDHVADKLFVFTFVRDPYARLVSGFLDKVTDLDQAYRPDLRDRLTADWGVALGPDADQVASFRAFVRFVDYQHGLQAEVDAGAEDDREEWQRIDLHWLNQSWYVQRGDQIAERVDFIGTIETMAEDLAVLTAHLGPKHKPDLAQMPRFGAGPKRKHPLPDYFDADTKAIVDRLYERDFALFGYPTTVGAEPEIMSGFDRAARFLERS